MKAQRRKVSLKIKTVTIPILCRTVTTNSCFFPDPGFKKLFQQNHNLKSQLNLEICISLLIKVNKMKAKTRNPTRLHAVEQEKKSERVRRRREILRIREWKMFSLRLLIFL